VAEAKEPDAAARGLVYGSGGGGSSGGGAGGGGGGGRAVVAKEKGGVVVERAEKSFLHNDGHLYIADAAKTLKVYYLRSEK